MLKSRWLALIVVPLGVLALCWVYVIAQPPPGPGGRTEDHIVKVSQGFLAQPVVRGLTYPTAIAWDDKGNMYVAEAGGAFLEEPPPARILRIQDNQATEVVSFSKKEIGASLVGLTWHKGAFFISHRDPKDRTGAVSRVTLDGKVTRILSGIIDSQAEHQVNDLAVGPDGRMYLASGPAANAAVVGIDIAPFVARSPGLHTTTAKDLVLTGLNYVTPDFRTSKPGDLARTGAFVPFGTPTTPGQVIKGTNKAGGAILVFDPNDAEATVRPFAWGFRNVIGFAWNKKGEMFAAVNGYDVRGSRPVNDNAEATYRVVKDAWYGWPEFSAAFEPVTDPKFDVPDANKVQTEINGKPQGKQIGQVIDLKASGLTQPDKALIHGLHQINSSPSKVAVAPDSWGSLAGQVFVAEWGDLTPPTNPLRDGPAPGIQVVYIDAKTRKAVPFVRNAKPGQAADQNAAGRGLERPFDVKFGPDGAMYIVDYGVSRVNQARAAEGQVPYEFTAGTGAVWKVAPARR